MQTQAEIGPSGNLCNPDHQQLCAVNSQHIYVTDDKGRKLNFKTVVTLCREFLKGLESENEITEKIKKFLILIRLWRSSERRMHPKSARPLTTKAA